MKKPMFACVSGPLEVYARGYEAELVALGYSHWTTLVHLELMGHVSRWLVAHGRTTTDFDDDRALLFLADRRASGQVRRLTPRGLQPLMGYLRSLSAIPESSISAPTGVVEELVTEFAWYLRDARGLSERTIFGHRYFATLFLGPVPAESNDLGMLSAKRVNEFVLAQALVRSAGSLGNVVASLRVLLDFLFLRGLTEVSLVSAVPAVAGWRSTGVPRGFGPGQVEKLLGSCDRDTDAGRRDFAIITIIARLGLRSAELAGLNVDDIDWNAGEMKVLGKGNRLDLLPLPFDVGQALANYCLHGRHHGNSRSLFVQVRAPYTMMCPSAVSYVVVRACTRAGLPPQGAHQLRHSAAIAMREAGLPLADIGEVLRHEHEVTTAGYARDGLDALATIARPWPIEALS